MKLLTPPTHVDTPVKPADFQPTYFGRSSTADVLRADVDLDLSAAHFSSDFDPDHVSSEMNSGSADPATLARTAAMILSAMDAAAAEREESPVACERREVQVERVGYRAPATLKLFADPVDAEPWPLFLRDLEARAAGFVCPDRVPLGYGGTLEFVGPDAKPVSVDVTLVRCRVCYGGWYEGALYFHRNQPELLDTVRDAE